MEEPIDFDYLMQSQPKIIIWARVSFIIYYIYISLMQI